MQLASRNAGWWKAGRRSYSVLAIVAAALALSGVNAFGRSEPLPEAGQLSSASSAPANPAGKAYSLHLYHLHTGESLDVVYRIGDQYIPEALDKLNHFLRDHRTQDASHYDPREFDLLNSIMARLGRPDGIIDIVCGYRTPWSNAFLRHGTAASGVAEHSQHMEAKAIDIRVPGVETATLRDTAQSFAAGGVGYYPVSQFVHVDVGPVRTWSFGTPSAPRANLHTAAGRAHGRTRRIVLHHVGD
jgi:uncharacterized protein YcbK (DUF882 family)